MYSVSTPARAPRVSRLAAAAFVLAAAAFSVPDAEAGSSRAKTHRAAKSSGQTAGAFSFFDLFKAPTDAKARPASRRSHARAAVVPVVPVAATATAAAAVTTTPAAATPGGSTGGTTGIASFYGGEHHGGPTASGERFNQHALTAAHRTAPLGSKMRVTNLNNGRSVVVRINDRGPFVRGRIIDVSRGAAEALGFTAAGLTKVRIDRES